MSDAPEPQRPEPRPPRRTPDDGDRIERPGRGRTLLVVLAVVLLVGGTSLRGVAHFYTDYVWYESLGQGSVFTGVLRAKLTLVAAFTAGFFVLLWVNLAIADRIVHFRRPAIEDEVVERWQQLVRGRTTAVRFAVAGVFALLVGSNAGTRWNEWLLFRNAVDFGPEVDPLFGRDLGWFVFRVPFLDFVVGWLFVALVIVLILTTIAHYLNGGIRLQASDPQRVMPRVKVHLSALLAGLAVVKAAGYWLQQFSLTVSTRGTVNGATYTDVNAQLPAIRLLILVAIAAALLFLVNMRRKGWVLPILGVGIWALVAVVGGAAVPAAVQYFAVKPSELAREREYIRANIDATRAALGLDEVETEVFAPTRLTTDELVEHADVLRSIRLWDTGILQDTFSSLQSQRPIYGVKDVDVDRYVIDGALTQVMISARDLDPAGVLRQGESWETQHLTYTHGHGLVASFANRKTGEGRPQFLSENIPSTASVEALEVDQQGLYIGEGLDGFVVVNTNRQEVDYENEEGGRVTADYTGADGVSVGSFLRRAAFALRFADINMLFSGSLTGESRIIYNRDVRDRVESLAPFLTFDSDPYPVVVDGRIQWIVDAYTTTDRYPYGQTAILDGDTGLHERRFNYVRNSVKAVVDAYDGTVTFYVIDDTDPIVQAYRAAFPSLFTDEAPSPELRDHFRYPEDLFRVQTNMWGRYQIGDEGDFFDSVGAWAVARDPSSDPNALPSPTTSTIDPDAAPRQSNRIEPYYLLTSLPGEEDQSFILLRPFVPFEGDQRPVLRGFLVAGNDADSYGRLVSYEVPASAQVDGPSQISATIQNFDEVARARRELCLGATGQTTSGCRFGNLVFVPIGDSLLYVQPLYITSDQTNLPLLRQVIVEVDNKVGIGNDLESALLDIFPDLPDDILDGEAIPDDPGEPEDPTAPVEADTVGELLAEAERLFDEADAALREGGADGLATYQDRLAEARDLVARAAALLTDQTQTATTPTTTATEPA